MSAHRMIVCLLAGCALMLGPVAASAQISVSPVNDLTFGQVLAGVPDVVAPTDAANRAELEIRGSGILALQFVLPTEMVSAQGNRLPLFFGPNDARARWRWLGLEFRFDPSQPYNLFLPALANGATVYLGGQARPTAPQAPGHYNASIILIVANAGT